MYWTKTWNSLTNNQTPLECQELARDDHIVKAMLCALCILFPVLPSNVEALHISSMWQVHYPGRIHALYVTRKLMLGSLSTLGSLIKVTHSGLFAADLHVCGGFWMGLVSSNSDTLQPEVLQLTCLLRHVPFQALIQFKTTLITSFETSQAHRVCHMPAGVLLPGSWHQRFSP